MEQQQISERLAQLPENPTAEDYRAAAKRLLSLVQARLPAMGTGLSQERLWFLSCVARHDLGLARLLEGHLDATQILWEANRPVASDQLYGVWASGGPADTAALEQRGESGLQLVGEKPFCSGSDIVDRALVYIYPAEQLLEVDMGAIAATGRAQFDGEQWKTSALAQTHTWTVRFTGVVVSRKDLVGVKSWYFDRPGFCLGAFAPAACWAGGAMGLVDSVRKRSMKDVHAQAHLGAMVSSVCTMQAMLRWGAKQIDTDPANASARLFPAALLVRHQIERACTDIMDRFGRTLGPRPLVFDEDNARRVAELTVYIRQCHAERDLEELGAYLETDPGFCSYTTAHEM